MAKKQVEQKVAKKKHVAKSMPKMSLSPVEYAKRLMERSTLRWDETNNSANFHQFMKRLDRIPGGIFKIIEGGN